MFTTHFLTPEEIADPQLVLTSLFEFANLAELRQLQRDSFYYLVCGTWPELTPQECSSFACLQEHLEKLVEACHLLATRQPPAAE